VLARAALARLAPEEAVADDDAVVAGEAAEERLEKPLGLHEQRLEAVTAALVAAGATSVADLGCGEGKLLLRLVRDRRFSRIIGLDASARALERAAAKLRLDIAGSAARERVILLHGALTYRDARWRDVDAAALVEVIDHLDLDRLPALAAVVFGAARPRSVIVTTPNAEHNALFPNLAAGAFRHPDHRFEWTRAEFRAWAAEIEARYGYSATFAEIGESHDILGAPTQMAVMTRQT
jgi:3' terminal RNA ribose 2'-O-methyltransferase Hen1